MSHLSDKIERFILVLLAEDEQVELRRNELAEYFHCAPSQINYVLSTRFSLERGYIIESRRGGGGFIRVVRVQVDEDDYLIHLVSDRLSHPISAHEADAIIQSMLAGGVISCQEAQLMCNATGDAALDVPIAGKDMVRASILGAIITGLIQRRNKGE